MSGLSQKEAFKLAAYQTLSKRARIQLEEEGKVQASTRNTLIDMDNWLASHFWFWKLNTTSNGKENK